MLCDKIKPSRFRHRVTLQSESLVADGGGGGGAPVWSDQATIWADIQPISGREILHSQMLQVRVTHRIITRYRAGVTTAMRLAKGARLFNIRAVINMEERNRYLEIMCEEGAAT